MHKEEQAEKRAYVHKLSEAEFRCMLCDLYGNDSLAVKAFDYVKVRMNAQNGYVRIYSGEDYFVHLQAVAEVLIDKVNAGDICVAVALLHDSIEDLPGDVEGELRCVFGNVVTDKVLLVTKKKDVDYENGDALKTYIWGTLTDEDAVLVKIADRMNNNSTLIGASEEKLAEKTEESIKYFAPLAIEAKRVYPKYSNFFTEAESFFMQRID